MAMLQKNDTTERSSMQNDKMNLLFEVTIPGRVGIKKNSRKIFKDRYGRTQSTPSKTYQNWEAMAHLPMLKAIRDCKLRSPIEVPIKAVFEFHFENHKALPDTSNCIEGPQDLMENYLIYNNDQQITEIEAKRFVSGELKAVVRLYGLEDD